MNNKKGSSFNWMLFLMIVCFPPGVRLECCVCRLRRPSQCSPLWRGCTIMSTRSSPLTGQHTARQPSRARRSACSILPWLLHVTRTISPQHFRNNVETLNCYCLTPVSSLLWITIMSRRIAVCIRDILYHNTYWSRYKQYTTLPSVSMKQEVHNIASYLNMNAVQCVLVKLFLLT